MNDPHQCDHRVCRASDGFRCQCYPCDCEDCAKQSQDAAADVPQRRARDSFERRELCTRLYNIFRHDRVRGDL